MTAAVRFALPTMRSPSQWPGSIVIRQGTGHIPGLTGRLNPILDTLGRTYLYRGPITAQPLRYVRDAAARPERRLDEHPSTEDKHSQSPSSRVRIS